MGKPASCQVSKDRFEEQAQIPRIQADEDGPRLEDKVHGINVAVARDLLQETIWRVVGQIVSWNLELYISVRFSLASEPLYLQSSPYRRTFVER